MENLFSHLITRLIHFNTPIDFHCLQEQRIDDIRPQRSRTVLQKIITGDPSQVQRHVSGEPIRHELLLGHPNEESTAIRSEGHGP
jgi:hypothetical protein